MCRVSRFHRIMHAFGAILISTFRRDPFIVYTSNIFAILGLRAMYFLLARWPTLMRYLRVGECASRLKVTVTHFLGFALVLLSMFFFYVE